MDITNKDNAGMKVICVHPKYGLKEVFIASLTDITHANRTVESALKCTGITYERIFVKQQLEDTSGCSYVEKSMVFPPTKAIEVLYGKGK